MPCLISEVVLGSTSVFSPNSQYIAIVSRSRLTIRLVETMEVVHVFACCDKIDKVNFSPDSEYVLCAMFTRNAVQVFSIFDGEWRCRINEGVAGIVNATWGPDSRSVLTESDFGLQTIIWSLSDNSSYQITAPKQLSSSALTPQLESAPCVANKAVTLSAFSDCGTFYAVIHRVNLSDHIGVYTTKPWGIANKFKGRSSDVVALTWTSCSRFLVTADSPLTYLINVYDLHGTHIASFEAYKFSLGLRQCVFARKQPLQTFPAYIVTRRGRPFAFHAIGNEQHSVSLLVKATHEQSEKRATAHVNYERELAVDDVDLPSLLALGSFDGRVRLVSSSSWKCAHSLPLVHPSLMEPGLFKSPLCTVELTSAQAEAECLIDTSEGDTMTAGNHEEIQAKIIFNMTASREAKAVKDAIKSRGACYVKKTLSSLPKKIMSKKQVELHHGPPLRGVSWLGWSANGVLLAAREATQPQCLWIWDAVQGLLVSLIVQLDSIIHSSWRPLVRFMRTASEGPGLVVDSIPVLAFCSGTARVYFWSPDAGPTWVDLPHSPDSSTTMIVNSVQWSQDGSRCLLQGTEGLCIATVYLDSQGGAMGLLAPSKAKSFTRAGDQIVEEFHSTSARDASLTDTE